MATRDGGRGGTPRRTPGRGPASDPHGRGASGPARSPSADAAAAAPAPEGLVLLGVVGAAHGVRGEVRIKSFTAEPTAIGEYGPLVTPEGHAVTLAQVRPAREVVIARIEGVTNREAAEALRGVRLHVLRARLPEPDDDEFYHADLVGLDAVTEAGEPFGRVVALHDFGAGDVVEIAPTAGGTTRFLPFTRAVVPKVDLAGRRLVVVPPSEIEGEERQEGAHGWADGADNQDADDERSGHQRSGDQGSGDQSSGNEPRGDGRA